MSVFCISFGMGIEFREASILIGPKSDVIATKGMVFNLNIGLSGLENKEAKDSEGKIYALFIGDTVIVNDQVCNFIILSNSYVDFV